MVMHYYNRHIGDYAKDTGHLTLLEHGVYTVLLDWSYATERSLPDETDAIYRICRAASTQEKRAVDRVVAEFFPAVDGKKTNNRTNMEIFGFHVKSENNSKAAGMRWNKDRNANASPPDSGSTTTRARVPSSNNQEPRTNSQQQRAAAEIPGDEEVRTWAQMAGIDPDYASHQRQKTEEDGTWLRNGRLADWRSRWLGFWNQDRENWMKKNFARSARSEGEPPSLTVPATITLAEMKV